MEYINDEGAQCELDVVRVLPEEEEEYVIESEHIESGPIYTEERLVGRDLLEKDQYTLKNLFMNLQ